MLYSSLHFSKSKRTESLDSWEPAMVITSLCGIYSGTLKITPLCKSLEWVGQPTLLTRHSWITWVDAKESRRLRTWASASLKSRKKVAKESQSKHPFRNKFSIASVLDKKYFHPCRKLHAPTQCCNMIKYQQITISGLRVLRRLPHPWIHHTGSAWKSTAIVGKVSNMTGKIAQL